MRAEVRYDDQRARLQAAMDSGVMREIAIMNPGEVRLYDEFRRFLGDGESASPAVAVIRRWVIAADEKGRFRGRKSLISWQKRAAGVRRGWEHGFESRWGHQVVERHRPLQLGGPDRGRTDLIS